MYNVRSFSGPSNSHLHIILGELQYNVIITIPPGCVDAGAPHHPPGPRDFCSGDYVQVVEDTALVDNQDTLALVYIATCTMSCVVRRVCIHVHV